MARLLAAYAISNEDLDALPVRELGAAIGFYVSVLGFALVRRDGPNATVGRDDVLLGLTLRPDHEPGRAGSLAIEVDELAELHQELASKGGQPGEFGVDEWDGRSHRTFFLREAENGYCFCFYRRI